MHNVEIHTFNTALLTEDNLPTHFIQVGFDMGLGSAQVSYCSIDIDRDF
jgi:hypothetical protein